MKKNMEEKGKKKLRERKLRQCPRCCSRMLSTSMTATGRHARASNGSGVVGTEVQCPHCLHAACFLDFDLQAFGPGSRRKCFTLIEVLAFIRKGKVEDLGNGCPITRREKEKNRVLENLASELEQMEAARTRSDQDIPF